MPAILFIALLLATAFAHSNLGEPVSYHRKECNAREGCGPCPIPPPGTFDKPEAVWARGAKVPVMWHRNNHKDGFIRRSLVPLNAMFSYEAHKQLAFNYGCYSQGTIKCPWLHHPDAYRKCGTDHGHFLHSDNMTVPAIFPDGDYIFAVRWFGGSDRPSTDKALFSNFGSCSYVRIQGGVQLTKTHIPTMTTGKTAKFDQRPGYSPPSANQCWSTASVVNQCHNKTTGRIGAACLKEHVKATTPGVFKHGPPKPILLSSVLKWMASQTPTPMPTSSSTISPALPPSIVVAELSISSSPSSIIGSTATPSQMPKMSVSPTPTWSPSTTSTNSALSRSKLYSTRSRLSMSPVPTMPTRTPEPLLALKPFLESAASTDSPTEPSTNPSPSSTPPPWQFPQVVSTPSPRPTTTPTPKQHFPVQNHTKHDWSALCRTIVSCNVLCDNSPTICKALEAVIG